MGEPKSLAAVCANIVDCAHKTAPVDESGEYFAVGTSAMRGNRIDYSEARRINQATFAAWTTRLRPKYGDLLLAREAPVGPVVRIPVEENVAPGQRTVLLRPDLKETDQAFLFYFLTWSRTQAALESMASGSTLPHLNVQDVRQLNVGHWPSLKVQRGVGEVLGSLDEKIATNERVLRLQDLLVRAMYNTLGGEQRELGEIASQVRTQVDPRRIPADTAYVGLEHLPRRRMWMQSEGVAGGLASAKFQYETRDLLFGKLRPYFHKVVTAKSSGICSTDILVVRAHDEMLSGLVLAACSSDEVVSRCSAMTEGTKMPRSSWGDLSSCPIRWPGAARAKAFSDKVAEISALAASLVDESERLARTRDELLPLLMSGRMSVAGAEREVSDAV